MSEPRQLTLDLGHRPALGAEDFLVGASNRQAVALIDRWPSWPAPSALVVGPPLSGKSHLAHVWQLRTGAGRVEAAGLEESTLGLFAEAGALVVEDIDRGIASEALLFHLMNLAREHSGFLLLTSARPAGDLAVTLPDLRSRLRAATMIEIDAPDDGLLAAVLVKHFADRQLTVEPSVVSFLVASMERTLAAAAIIVAEIDRLALASRRRVTRTLAAEVLSRLATAEAGDPPGHPADEAS